MKEFTIKKVKREGEDYETMVIFALDRTTAHELAEYRLTTGKEKAEIARMRRSINRHLEEGGELRNYQW